MRHGVATWVIETERLRLRPHVADDLAASWAMWPDPHVYRYIVAGPANEQRNGLVVRASA
jgi:hypothetical protein